MVFLDVVPKQPGPLPLSGPDPSAQLQGCCCEGVRSHRG